MRAKIMNVITFGLWRQVGEILKQYHDSLDKASKIIGFHEDMIGMLRDEVDRLTWRLNETQRHLEQYERVVFPAPICGPTQTTLGEFGIGTSESPMPEEEQARVKRALEVEEAEAEQRALLSETPDAPPEVNDAGSETEA